MDYLFDDEEMEDSDVIIYEDEGLVDEAGDLGNTTLDAILQQSTQDRGIDLSTFGLNDPSWVSFLKDFASATIYQNRIKNFLVFYTDEEEYRNSLSMEASLISYFEVNHDKGNAPSSLQSWFAMFKKFWKYTGRGDLMLKAPLIQDNIKKWTKDSEVTQATTFEKTELVKYLNRPDDPDNLIRKCFAVVAVGTSGRKVEICLTLFEDISKAVDQKTGLLHYLIQTRKKKNVDAKMTGFNPSNTVMITGELEVNCITRYLACFHPDEQKGMI